jgi:cell migration-inducing and hyaluronan-binding protein
LFSSFTDIDRQTELSDDDGSLTGLLGPLVDPQTKTYDPAISVNKDNFFNAPVQTAECASDIPALMPQGADCPYATEGPLSSDLCATAKTSPYEYTTTVVFPACAVSGTCGSSWGSTCQDQTCYGVPLYREDLNPNEIAASEIRMMADATYQRSNLTANHGLYYIDTTVSQTKQASYTFPNIFESNQEYYVFPLFAQPDTSITFQLYVGANFDTSTLSEVRVNQMNNPPTFTTVGAYPCPSGGCYDSATGILTVPLNMSLFSDFQTNFDAERQNECAPATFCSWNSSNSSCYCNPQETSAPPKECQNACHNWSTKDVDCPSGGCYGFAFTLPTGFVAGNPVVPPPNVGCYPKNSDWNVQFSNPTQDPGACLYVTPPPTGVFCSSSGKLNDLKLKF